MPAATGALSVAPAGSGWVWSAAGAGGCSWGATTVGCGGWLAPHPEASRADRSKAQVGMGVHSLVAGRHMRAASTVLVAERQQDDVLPGILAGDGNVAFMAQHAQPGAQVPRPVVAGVGADLPGFVLAVGAQVGDASNRAVHAGSESGPQLPAHVAACAVGVLVEFVGVDVTKPVVVGREDRRHARARERVLQVQAAFLVRRGIHDGFADANAAGNDVGWIDAGQRITR